MKQYLNMAAYAAVAAFGLGLAPVANAAVIIGDFSLTTGNASGNNVHGIGGNQSSSTVYGFVKDGNANIGNVTFSTTDGKLNLTGGGLATIYGDPKKDALDNLTVTFDKGWDLISFNLAGHNSATIFSMTVNGTLFSGFSSDLNCGICNLSGNGDFTLSGKGITELSFNFNPSIDGVKQFRVGVSNVPAVPEPATWAMMIGGLGIVGASMRRRSTKVQFA